MKIFLGIIITALTISPASAGYLSAPYFNKTYQPHREPLLPLPPPAESQPIPSNQMDNFILALARCQPNTVVHTPYGPNRIIGLENNLCRVTFSLSQLQVDCQLPQQVIVSLQKGIDVNQYCSQSHIPLVPSQRTLLKLFR